MNKTNENRVGESGLVATLKAPLLWFWNYIQTTQGRDHMNALGAAVFWGGWGFSMNYEHGIALAIQVGLTQGSLNFITNLVGTYILEFFYFNFSKRPWLQGIIAFFGTYSITLTVILSAHLWVGTPELIKTIGPSVSIGMVMTVIYLVGLNRLEAHKSKTKAESAEALNGTAQ